MGEEWRMGLLEDVYEWDWSPIRIDESFDFGDPEYFDAGVRILGELTRHRHMCTRPVFTWMKRVHDGIRAIRFQLEARVNVFRIRQEEWARAKYEMI